MALNGFSAGVEPGGVYESRDIKLLLCYLLMSVPEPLPRQTVLDIVAGGGMANFFDTGSALDELIALHNVEESPSGLLTLTPEGRAAAASLANRLPWTLRDRSVKAALALLARTRREKENTFSVEKQPTGCAVTCRIRDGESDLMTLTLHVADEWQADAIGARFTEDPSALYRAVLDLLAGS